MRILQVNPYFAPCHGGSSRSAYDLSKYLSKVGHEVVFYTSNYKVSQQWIDSLSQVEIHPFINIFAKGNVFLSPRLIEVAKAEVKSFDIVHLHNYRTFQNVVVSHFALKCNIPYVLQAHGSLPVMMGHEEFKKKFDSYFGHKMLQGASKVIALNRFEANQYIEFGLPEKKIEVVPNGIDTLLYQPSVSGRFKAKFGIAKETRLILYLGRLHKIKGIDFLVKAFATITKKTDHVKLVIVGPDDGYLPELLNTVRNLGMEKDILFTGPLFGQEKFDAYLDSNVYVLPSIYECFPIGLLEAWAFSKPVIAWKVGGLVDLVVNGKTGFLIDYGNISELEQRILFLINHPKEAEEIGLKGRQFIVENFHIQSVVDKIENVYKDVLLNRHNNS